MWVVAIRRSTRRTETCFLFTDPVPTPHANLIATFAREKLAIRNVEFFATERADVILLYDQRKWFSVME
jgi:hypothetical protein